MERKVTLALAATRPLTRPKLLSIARLVELGIVIYALVGAWLWNGGYIATPLLFLSEKMAIAVGGQPSRMIGATFVYPPLALALMAPFRHPALAQAVVGAIIDGLFIWWTERHIDAVVTRRLTQLSFLGSALVLYTTIEDAGALLACELATLASFALLRFFEYAYSMDLFSAGVLIGLTFFVDFRVIALVIVFVPTIIWMTGRFSRTKCIAVLLTLTVPTALMTLGWTYVNWMFIGDPLGFVHGPASFFHIRDVELTSHTALAPRALVSLTLMLCPVWLAPFSLRHLERRTQLAASVMIVGAVLWAAAFTFFTATSSITIWLIPLGTAIAFATPRRPSLFLQGALIVSVLGSWCLIAVDPGDAGRFYQSLRWLTPVSTVERLAPIRRALPSGGDVLADDTQFYGLVALDRDPGRFILPYAQRFTQALNDPVDSADDIVIALHGEDRIRDRYPDVLAHGLPGFHIVNVTSTSIVLARNASPPTPVASGPPPLTPSIRLGAEIIAGLLSLLTLALLRHTLRTLTGASPQHA